MKVVIRSPEMSDSKKILEYGDAVESLVSDHAILHKEFVSNACKTDTTEQGQLAQRKSQALIEELHKENASLKEDIETLQTQYDELKQLAEDQQESIKQTAYEEGMAQADKEIQLLVDKRLNAGEGILNEIKERVVSDIYQKESMCLEIVYAAICRLVGDSAGSKQQVKEILRLTIEKISDPKNIDIYVSEHDYESLLNDEFIEGNIIKSDDISHGGCIIKTGRGSVEAKLEKQLLELKALLLNVHKTQQG